MDVLVPEKKAEDHGIAADIAVDVSAGLKKTTKEHSVGDVSESQLEEAEQLEKLEDSWGRGDL